MCPECQLFVILNCPRCALAEAALLPLVDRGLWVELVDLHEARGTPSSYEARAPLLRRVDTGAELDWPFSEDQVVHFLK
jgi:hypothetical protein